MRFCKRVKSNNTSGLTGFLVKINHRVFLVIMILLFINFFSCNDADPLDCFKSTGKIERVERSISDFTSILLKDNVNLILRQADKNKLEVEGGSKLLPKIFTTVNDEGVLEISNENSCNWVRSYDKPLIVYLDFITLDTLEYRSIGDVTNIDTIRMDTIVVDVREGAGTIAMNVHAFKVNTNLHYGTATIVMSGISTLSFDYLVGFGKIDNSSLISSQVYLENKSSNNIYVNSVLTLEATINNIGNVYYKGNPPNILVGGTGSGKLIKLE
jgi:hypothetical protein